MAATADISSCASGMLKKRRSILTLSANDTMLVREREREIARKRGVAQAYLASPRYYLAGVYDRVLQQNAYYVRVACNSTHYNVRFILIYGRGPGSNIYGRGAGSNISWGMLHLEGSTLVAMSAKIVEIATLDVGQHS